MPFWRANTYCSQINCQQLHTHTHWPSTVKLSSIDSHTHLLGSLGSHAVSDGSSEQQYVWFWLVYHVVDPALRLLDTNRPPFCFGHELVFGNQLCDVLWKHDMSVWMCDESKKWNKQFQQFTFMEHNPTLMTRGGHMLYWYIQLVVLLSYHHKSEWSSP